MRETSPLLINSQTEEILINVGRRNSIMNLNAPQNLRKISSKRRNITFAILNVICNVLATVMLPIFAGTMNEIGSDVYTLLIETSLVVTVLFAMITLLVKYTKLDPNATLRPTSTWKVLFAMGLFTAIYGILNVNASPPDRTPPYLQGILSATVIPYAVVCRLIILRKGISTARALCTLVVLVGVFITTEPQIFGLDFDGGDGPTPSTAARILWPFCFSLGFLPVGLSNVFCEKELKKNEGDSLGFITWTSFFQFIIMIFFFWTDFLPHFGTSSSASEFNKKLQRGMHCIYSSDSTCRNVAGKAWLFYAGYCLGNLFQFMLIQYAEGAVYAVIVQALISPMATLFWTFFKYDEVNDFFSWKPVFNTTTGFTLAGLCLIVPGVILYNHFSRKECLESNVPDVSITVNTQSGDIK